MGPPDDARPGPHLQAVLAHAARVTGFLPGDFELVGERTIRSAMDMDGTSLHVIDLRGPEGVAYRARSVSDEDSSGHDFVQIAVVVGEGHLADERPVDGRSAHDLARTAALNYSRYIAALTS